MKKMKKIMALVIAMVMILAMGVPVMAEGETTTNGSITIKSPVMGATYDAYKVFDLVLSEDGTGVSYTIESTSPFYPAVASYAATEANGLTLNAIPSEHTETYDKFNVVNAGSFDAKKFGEFLQEHIDSKAAEDDLHITATPTTKTVSSQEDAVSVEFENLNLGYYLILSTYEPYNATATLKFIGTGTPEEPEKVWTFTKDSTEAEVKTAAEQYADKVYPDLDSAEAYVNDHASDFEKTWAEMTDAEKQQVWKDLKDSLVEDTVKEFGHAVNELAAHESDDNTLTNRLVIVDSTTPDVVVYEKNEVDKWDVPLNPEGHADLPDIPEHGEPDGGKNLVLSEDPLVYADWAEANVGDDLHYQLRINAMNYVRTNPSNTTDTTGSIEQVKEYIIADYQAEGLEFDEEQGIMVKVIDKNGNVIGIKEYNNGEFTDPAAANYVTWKDHFFLNDEGDADIANPSSDILGNGGGIVIPWVYTTTTKPENNPNYTVTYQDKKVNGVTQYVKEDVLEDENGDPVPARDDNGTVMMDKYVSVNGNVVDSQGYLLDDSGERIPEKEEVYVVSLYPSESTIVVDYHMTLTDKAVIDGTGNINWSQYGMNYVDEDDYDYNPQKPGEENPDKPGEPDEKRTPDSATVYTYALAIQKTDENGNNIGVAKFVAKGLTVEEKAEGYYMVTEYDPKSDDFGTEMSTNEDGLLVIEGLTSDPITFKETEAPEGYNLLTEPFEHNAEKLSEEVTTTVTTTYYNEDGSVAQEASETTTEKKTFTTIPNLIAKALKVENHKGTELPSTGGIGTTLFYIIGAILVIGGGVVLITRRRMSAR